MPRYNQKSVTVSISLKNRIREYMRDYGFHSQPQAIEDALTLARGVRAVVTKKEAAAE
ncbi:hypothetical protein [Nitrososphaera sp.]|uniref:hypothetical protein n=1 Tax=Nitrososphaera sp. TaxID=1971748 RepID=UPI0031743D5A